MIYYPPIGFSPSFLRFCRSSPFELEHGGAYELLVGGSFTGNFVVCASRRLRLLAWQDGLIGDKFRAKLFFSEFLSRSRLS